MRRNCADNIMLYFDLGKIQLSRTANHCHRHLDCLDINIIDDFNFLVQCSDIGDIDIKQFFSPALSAKLYNGP